MDLLGKQVVVAQIWLLAPRLEVFQCPYKVPRNEKGYDWSVDPQSLCEYFDALTTAQNADYFISNMSYLMAMNRSSSMLRQRKFLIVDEAHQLASAMTSFYSLDFSVKVIERLLQLPSHQQVLEAAEKDREIMQKDRTKNLESWTPANSGWGSLKFRLCKLHLLMSSAEKEQLC